MLTDAELELMTILWKIGEGTVGEVVEHLPMGRDVAYTTISTHLRILEQKKKVRARKEGRGHSYVPLVSKQEYEAQALRHMVDKVFDGTPLSLVRQLLSTEDFASSELTELRRLLDRSGAV